MKLLDGKWSKGDVFALFGVVAAVLATPGMPKLFHWDSDSSSTHVETPVSATGSKAADPALMPVHKARDVSSGQVNFGYDQSLQVQTPVVSFGKNPRNIESRAIWANTDNVKTQNQSVVNIEDAMNHHVSGVKAVGTISGRDSESILGVKKCPGGGHGELTAHVS